MRTKRYKQPTDFVWLVSQDDAGKQDSMCGSCGAENRLLREENRAPGSRAYELLLLGVLLCAVIGYITWREFKIYWLNSQAAAQESTTAAQEDALALIEIEIDPATLQTESEPYRRKQLYRRVEGVWRPTAPDAAFWGERHTLETDYFHLEFYDADAPAVQSVATELDALLRTLHQQVGLAPPSGQRKRVIQVLPDADLQRHPPDPFHSPHVLAVSSPMLLPIPASWTEADALRDQIIPHLAARTLYRKVAPLSREAWWGDAGIQGVLRWLIEDAQTKAAGLPRHGGVSSTTLPQEVDTPAPRLIDISGSYLQPPQHNTYWIEAYSIPALDRQAMTVESLIEYVLSTYGQEHLPPLIEAMRHQADWTERVPAIFGVSVETFERGWREYLTNQRVAY